MSGLVPSLHPSLARFRGPASSDEYNVSMRAISTDLIAAYQALETQNTATLLANEVLSVANTALTRQLAATQAQLANLQTSFAALKVLGSATAGMGDFAVMGISLYDADVQYGGVASYAHLPSATRADYAPLYGQLTPHVSNPPISKLFVTDILSGRVVVPSGVAHVSADHIHPTVPPFATEKTDPQNCIGGGTTSLWRQNLYFPQTAHISEVDVSLTLTLPTAVVDSLLCNYLIIHPYPEMAVDLTSVVIHGDQGATQLLPMDANGTPIALAAAGKTRFFFVDQELTHATITLRSGLAIRTLKPGLQAFILGATFADLGLTGFNQNPSKALIPFTLNQNYFSYLIGTPPLPTGITIQPYVKTASGDYVKLNFGEKPHGYCQTVVLEVTFTPAQGLLPVLEDLQLQFIPLYTT